MNRLTFTVLFDKKVAPSKGYVQKVPLGKVFKTKTEARKVAIRIMSEKKQYFGADICTVDSVGKSGQYYGTDWQRFSTSDESISRETEKGRTAYYISHTFHNSRNKDKVVNRDGTLSKQKIQDWVLARNPKAYDYDWLDNLDLKPVKNRR